MSPLYKLDLGDEISLAERNALFYEHKETRLFRALLQTLREEAFNCLGESVTAKAADKHGISDMMMGGFTQISKVTCYVAEQSLIAPGVE